MRYLAAYCNDCELELDSLAEILRHRKIKHRVAAMGTYFWPEWMVADRYPD